MISTITINNVADFQSAELSCLEAINFIYGANGTGKTTISRVLARRENYSECSITWRHEQEMQILVYNRDFVAENFNEHAKLKGIFTLGKESNGLINEIEEMQISIDKLIKDIETLKSTLISKNLELDLLEENFEKFCWSFKQSYDDDFKEAFTGYRNNQNKFKSKFILEADGNTAELVSLEVLKSKYNKIFSNKLKKISQIQVLEYEHLTELERLPILAKKVIGKDDIDIAALIKKLGNSDWVKQGLGYFENSPSLCPFCQQETETAFAESLRQYFDQTYLTDIELIEALVKSYEDAANNIIQQIQNITMNNLLEIDCDKLKQKHELLLAKISINKDRIAIKRKEASREIVLESLLDILSEIDQMIANENVEIESHNRIVDNLEQEEQKLVSKIWQFIVNEAKYQYDDYKNKKNGLDLAIASLNKKIMVNDAIKLETQVKIRNLQKSITSIETVVIEINELLERLGFVGFKLSVSETAGYYKIIRLNGTEARSTLSEGERTFLTFLYFYHRINGSVSESELIQKRIIVIDDPVSSLDTQILFVVSRLIRRLIETIRSKTSHVHQIFVLTHNIYFHKEVTFNKKKPYPKDVTFWIVKKSNNISTIHNLYKSRPDLTVTRFSVTDLLSV